MERHCCSERPSATGSDVWVAVDFIAADISQCNRQLPSETGFTVWAAVDRVAMDASLVMFCWITDHLGSTERAFFFFCVLGWHAVPAARLLLREEGPLACFLPLHFSPEFRSTFVSVPLSMMVEMLRRCPLVGTLVLGCCHAARTREVTRF